MEDIFYVSKPMIIKIDGEKDLSVEIFIKKLLESLEFKNEILVKTSEGMRKVCEEVIKIITNATGKDGWYVDNVFIKQDYENKSVWVDGKKIYKQTKNKINTINYVLKRSPAIMLK